MLQTPESMSGSPNNVVVRQCTARYNVAGIEIENCRVADVYNNLAEENTGGLLIFDMPNLPQPNGYKISIHDNIVKNNNFENFAPEGGMVAVMPPGSGILVMGHEEVEIYNNTITDYKTIGLGVVSYLFTGKKFKKKENHEYRPYCSAISIHDNTFSTDKLIPDVTKDLGKLVGVAFQGPMDIVFDGWWDPELEEVDGNLTGENKVCFRNNGEDVKFACLYAGKAKDEMDMLNTLTKDISIFDCEGASYDVAPASNWLAGTK